MLSFSHIFLEYRTSDWGMPQEEDYFGPILDPDSTEQPHGMCRYRAYRAPPGQHDEYLINKTWLHVFAARLAFVAVFEVSQTFVFWTWLQMRLKTQTVVNLGTDSDWYRLVTDCCFRTYLTGYKCMVFHGRSTTFDLICSDT